MEVVDSILPSAVMYFGFSFLSLSFLKDTKREDETHRVDDPSLFSPFYRWFLSVSFVRSHLPSPVDVIWSLCPFFLLCHFALLPFLFIFQSSLLLLLFLLIVVTTISPLPIVGNCISFFALSSPPFLMMIPVCVICQDVDT